MQNDVHGLIGNAENRLGYVHPGLRAALFVHAGAGGRAGIGPFALELRTMGLLTTSGWSRWRAECTLEVASGGSGVWAGVRRDGAAGHALTTIADAVARHESGLGVYMGMSWQVRDLQLGFETAHNLDTGDQNGFLSFSYAPPPTSRPAPLAEDAVPWHSHLGVSFRDSRVLGTGVDEELSSGSPALPPWLGWIVGFRDQHMLVPDDQEISGNRLLLWAGLGADPLLLGSPHASLSAHIACGVGLRQDRVTARGFARIDGGDSITTYVPLARAAAGLQACIVSGSSQVGVQALLEATAAPLRQARVYADNPDPAVVRLNSTIALDGSSVGLVLALTTAWSW